MARPGDRSEESLLETNFETRGLAANMPGLSFQLPALMKGRLVMIDRLRTLQNALARTVAAIAIVVFWCITAVGTTIGTAGGVTTLATAINAAATTPAEARRRYRRRGWRRGGGYGYPYYRRRHWYGGYPYYGYGYPYRRRGWWGPRFGIGFGF